MLAERRLKNALPALAPTATVAESGPNELPSDKIDNNIHKNRRVQGSPRLLLGRRAFPPTRNRRTAGSASRDAESQVESSGGEGARKQEKYPRHARRRRRSCSSPARRLLAARSAAVALLQLPGAAPPRYLLDGDGVHLRRGV